MDAITVYAPDAEDFSTLGLGVLTPCACTVTWQAAGDYELTLEQPIDGTNRWRQLQTGCILAAPVPMRESPSYGSGGTGSVTWNVWEVKPKKSEYLYSDWKTKSKRLRSFKGGAQLIELERREISGKIWIRCMNPDNGETGHMPTSKLTLNGTRTDFITNGRPEGQQLVRQKQSRRQLFRVYSTEHDSDTGIVTAKARHIFYDLAGDMLNGKFAPENVPGALAAQEAFTKLKNADGFTLYIEQLTKGSVTADYSYQNPVNILLDPDDGIVSKCKCQILTDNFDIYLIDDIPSDMGVTVRRGKNLVGVTVTTDDSDVVTQIKPCGKDVDGNDFWLTDTEGDGRFVVSSRAAGYPVQRTVRIEYDVKLVKSGEDNETSFRNNATGKAKARAKLKELAENDFANGADLPTYGMDVDFVLLQDAHGDSRYADLQAVHPYDTVTVIDSMLGVTAKLRMTGYEWDALARQYNSVTLGELQELKHTVYSYNLPNGGVSGNKIAPGTANGAILRDASIQYAKISVAAIEQLSAQAITALQAHINEIVAGSVTTDALYAAFAELIALKVGTIDAGNIQADALGAELARISRLVARTADVDWAHIKDLTTDTAIITQGVGGKLMISRLAVTEANMVSLTTGELVVKGADGSFYSVSVDDDGNVVATLKQIGNGDVLDLSINAGEKLIEGSVTTACLNAREIFADSALVRELIAANLDVDSLFARDAFVDKLRTSRIYGGKSLEMIVGNVDASARIFRQEDMPGATEGVKNGDLWIIPSAGQTWQATAAEELNLKLAVDEYGYLAYEINADADKHRLYMEDGELRAEGFAFPVDEDGNIGEAYTWALVRDDALVEAVDDANGRIESLDDSMGAQMARIEADYLSRPDFERIVKEKAEGLYIGDNLSPEQLLLGSGYINFLVDGVLYSRMGKRQVQFGNYILGLAPDDGLAFRPAGG